MNDIYLIFNNKFKVPHKLKNIIHKIFNKEEAIILNNLLDKEKRKADIISEFPFLESSLVESLYKKGYLINQFKGSEEYYRSNTFDQILKRFVILSQEFRKLSSKEMNVIQESITNLSIREMRESEEPVYRVIPIGIAIRDRRQLIPYQQAKFYLQNASHLTLVDCLCRTTFDRCDKPRRVCIALNDKAKFFIDREIGEIIDIQESLEILNRAEKNGLLHSINNKESPDYLCNCCECCCVFVQGLKKYGIYTSIGKSGFTATIDHDMCNLCEICIEKCIFDAISFEKDQIQFYKQRCFGCGLCVYFCPQKAIRLDKYVEP